MNETFVCWAEITFPHISTLEIMFVDFSATKQTLCSYLDRNKP